MKKDFIKKFFIEDNACTPYKLILNRAHNYLLLNGMEATNCRGEADIIIIGTCGAFQSMEEETIRFIEKAKAEKKKDTELIVFGCLPGIHSQRVKSYMPDRIVHSSNWEQIELLIDNPLVPLQDVPEANKFRDRKDYRLYDESKQFVLIQTGCSSDCPFCPHKMGIGNLKSLPPDNILKQVHYLDKEENVNTICLTGNDTGSYGTDINTTYPALLKQVLVESSLQIHISQMNPDWVYKYKNELWQLLVNRKVREFQMLIQSVSDRVLEMMERKPVVRSLKEWLRELRKARPDLIFRTDLIIGYPTSTEEEEQESLKYVAELFDEVAVHGFERFKQARIEKQNVPFYASSEVNLRVEKALAFFRKYPKIIVHRGGQVIKSLEAIEQPKDELRKKNNSVLSCGA